MNLQSWYRVAQADLGERALHIRLEPDHFLPEHTDPIVEVEILRPRSGAIAFEQLARFEHEPIVELQIVATRLEAWGEFDESPTVIAGDSISVRQGPYSRQDLLRIVLSQQATIARIQSKEARLRRATNEIEAFVRDLIRRAQSKKALSERSTEREDAQLDVLQRVAQRILDGKAAAD